MNTKIVYYENKSLVTLVSGIVLLVCLLYFDFGKWLIHIPLITFIWIWLYPSAKITISDSGLEYKKGKKTIAVPWNEVKGIHRDPVWASNLVNYYIARKIRTGGFFIETSQGFTSYIGPLSKKRWDLTPLDANDLFNEIRARSATELKTGAVSLFKQRQKLHGIIALLAAIFIVPAIIILLVELFAPIPGIL